MSRMLHMLSYSPALTRLAADRRGVAGIVTAIAATMLMGFCGLAVDVIMWEVNQRSLQGAADQATLAAAIAFRNAGETGPMGDSATAKNGAYATAIRSGYPAASVTPAAYNNGTSCTNDGCLKVTITQQQQLGEPRAQCAQCALNDSVVDPCARAFLVLLLRQSEKDHRLHAEPQQVFALLHHRVDGVPRKPRQALVRQRLRGDEERHHEVVDRERGLAHEIAEGACSAQAAQAGGRERAHYFSRVRGSTNSTGRGSVSDHGSNVMRSAKNSQIARPTASSGSEISAPGRP